MKRHLFFLTVGLTLASAGAANACSNGGICGQGWQDRGSRVTVGGHTASYGSGYGSGYGYGGAGGNGYGGSANASNYSRNTNSQTQNNNQTNRQTQNQSLANSGNNTVSNAGNNTLSADNRTANTNTNANNNNIANSSDNRSSNSANTVVSYTNVSQRAPVATAYAAPLTAGVDTCMGSTSVGGQGITIGFSAASTWTDRSCVRLKTSRELNAMGFNQAACELLAMDKEVAEAIRRAGASCGVFIQAAVQEWGPPPPPPPLAGPPPVEYLPPPPPVEYRYERSGERG